MNEKIFINHNMLTYLKLIKRKIGSNRKRKIAIKKKIPGIILVTLPKSASIYMRTKLAEGLNIPISPLQLGHFDDILIHPEYVRDIAKGGIIAQSHFSPKHFNLAILQNSNINKIIVNVRDPRQAMLSWVHHILKEYSHPGEEVPSLAVLPPRDFFSKDISDLISWHLDNYYPKQIAWIDSWYKTKMEKKWDIDILLTRYEDFNSKKKEFFHSILDFYNIDKSLFLYEEEDSLKEGDLHFRKGKTDEWRNVFSDLQSQKAWERIPGYLAKEFGWT